MKDYSWRVYLLAYGGLTLSSMSGELPNPSWAGATLWILGYIAVMSAVGSAVRAAPVEAGGVS